ncbi:MAG: competence/damage-inducible protein A [Candidatus Sulfobium sp.]|jgi:molybdenum cofactor synthesis domain-containing protein
MNEDGGSTKTAGIIIIGNEILSGKVRDSNSFYLASELRSLGVKLMRITVIPDEIGIIGSEAAMFSQTYDYVFTAGGVGPTHDDVTMAGIAHGFGIKLIVHPALEQRFRRRYGDGCNEAIMKMAVVPEGTHIITHEGMRFPVMTFRNIFILPGIPEYLREKFTVIKERFRSSSYCLRKFFINADESDITAVLNSVVSENPDVSFGSYPVVGNPEYKVVVTAECKSDDLLGKAVKALEGRLPEDIVVRIE